MKKNLNSIIILFTVLNVLCFNNLLAQSPILKAANTSLRIGDTFVFHYCTTNTFDTSGAGANQVWNYSYLIDSNLLRTGPAVIDTQICVDPKQRLYGDSFPSATFATTHTNPSGVTPHNDYWSGNTSYYYWGYYANLNHTIYKTPPAEIPLYPVYYGGSKYIGSYSYVDSSFLNPLPQTMPYTYTGIDSSYVDGYGTLMLPDATIQNVLRIKTILIDSTPTTTPGVIFTRKLVAYYFFTPNYHANILALQDGFTFYTLNGVIQSALSAEGKIIYRAANTLEILPLQIISFNASLRNSNVAVTWQTATEENTNYFNILRSTDGVHFNTIDKVSAAGKSNIIKTYTYTDINAALLNTTAIYYRLQELDKDGKGTYSKIQLLHLSKKILITVTPNPVNDFINITSSADIKNAKISLIDMSGKRYYTTVQNLSGGSQFQIPVSKLSRGTYVVNVESDEVKEQVTIIK